MSATGSRREFGVTDWKARPRWQRHGALAVLAAAALFGLGCAVGGDVVAYDVPAESARYSFASETNGVKTVWEYTSDRPSTPDAPEVRPCMGAYLGVTDTNCRPEPLIFLRYDLGLQLDNTVKASGTHRIRITGYYQERLSKAPTVTTLRVEVSFDGEKTWRPAQTAGDGANTFVAEIKHPSKNQVPGAVALRISATDSAGNTVKQTMPAAYRLS